AVPPVLRLEMIDQQRQSLSPNREVYLQAITRENGASYQVSRVGNGMAYHCLSFLRILHMSPNIHDFDVRALSVDQEPDVDPSQVVAVNREHPIAVVVEVRVIEVAQGVNVLDFLDGKNIGLSVQDGQRGIVALYFSNRIGDEVPLAS